MVNCTYHSQVSALNRFTPPAEVTASYDHRINVMGAVKKPARIRFRLV